MRLIIVAIALLLIGMIFGCREENVAQLPDDIAGRWTTTHPKYKDRHIEFEQFSISFGTGGDSSEKFEIRKVVAVLEDQRTLYTVYYVDEERTVNQFGFYYQTGGPISLKNQEQVVWEKTGKYLSTTTQTAAAGARTAFSCR